MNDRDRMILEEFSNSLKDFIVGFHNLFSENNIIDTDMNQKLDVVQERSTSSKQTFNQHIEWYEKQIAELNAKMSNESGAALDFYQVQLDRLNKGLEKTKSNNENKQNYWRELAIDVQRISEEKKEEIRAQLKEQFKRLSDYLGPTVFANGVGQARIIDSLVTKYEGDLVLAMNLYTRLRKRIDDPNEKSNKTELRKEANRIYADIKRLQNVTSSLKGFLKAYQGLEDTINNENVFDHFYIVENYFYSFADTLDAIEQTTDTNALSVNIKQNSNGTYNVDISCGYRFMEPSLCLTQEELNGDKIKDYVEKFASILSNKTSFTYDGLVNGDVAFKYNDKLVKKGALKEVNKFTDEIKEKNVEKVEDDTITPDNTQTKGDGTVTPDNTQTKGDGTVTPDNTQTKDDGTVAPDNTQTKGDGTVTPSQGIQQAGGNNNFYQNFNNQSSELAKNDEHLLKVLSKKESKYKLANFVRVTTLIACVGLAFTPFMSAQFAFAVLGGSHALATVLEGASKLVDYDGYRRRKRKLKRLAKKMSKETMLDIRLDIDTKNRKAGFVLGEEKTPLTSEFLHSSELIAQGQDDQILDMFDNAFRKLNKYRGLGNNARTQKEKDYRDFPKITFDNVTAAFQDFGGIKTRKEEKERFNAVKRFISDRLHRQELDQNDLVDSIDIVDPAELNDNTIIANPADIESYASTQLNGLPSSKVINNSSQVSDPTPIEENQENNAIDSQEQEVGPLAPSNEDPVATNIRFDANEQQSKKEEVVLAMRDKVEDPTDSIEVADLLNAHLNAYKDELSEQSKIDLVNMFHQEAHFTKGQMERFDFFCRNDRTLTDFEAKEAIVAIENAGRGGEEAKGNAISDFLSKHRNLTIDDVRALERFDITGDIITDNLKSQLFNGKTDELENNSSMGRNL